MAAGRWRSAATSAGAFPSLRRSSASFAEAVVFPEPWRPAMRMTVGGRPANASFELPCPMIAGRALLHARDEVLDDLEVDVGLEEGEPDLPHRPGEVLLGQLALPPEVAES